MGEPAARKPRRLDTQVTMAEAFRRAAERRLNQEALVCGDFRATYRHVQDRVSALARGLRDLGVEKQDVVASCVPPSPEFIYLFFALAELGAVIAPFDPQSRPEHLARLLVDSGAKAIMASERSGVEEAIELVREERADAGPMPLILDTVADNQSGLSVDRLLAEHQCLEPVASEVTPDDWMALLYTSGTTGRPKGAIHTHRSLIAPVVASLVVREAFTRHPSLGTVGRMAKVLARYGTRVLKAAVGRQIFLCTVGCHSMTGVEVMLQALLMGDTLVLMPKSGPLEALQLVQRERVTILIAVPTTLAILMRLQQKEAYDLSSLLICGTGSAPCPEQLAREVRDRLGCAVHIGFGATELGGGISATSLDDSADTQVQTVGRPMPGMQVRIVDESRQEVPAGHVGELACRGESVMKGYLGAPEKTAQVMDDEGWYYTGDLATLDTTGHLRIVGRKKDMIIRGGQNVYPEDIEQYLIEHTGVREAAVVGVPGAAGSEVIWAFAIPEEGQDTSPKALMSYCREGLARYQLPDQVRFVADFPRTSLGKPRKLELRELALREGFGRD